MGKTDPEKLVMIGMRFMRRFYTIFDKDRGMIGFAKSKSLSQIQELKDQASRSQQKH